MRRKCCAPVARQVLGTADDSKLNDSQAAVTTGMPDPRLSLESRSLRNSVHRGGRLRRAPSREEVLPMSAVPWKVRQYCYFWIASPVVTASEITELLGVAPDRVRVRGSKRAQPTPVPAEHAWEIRCERHARIDEQADEVLRRIEPVADKVRLLTNRGDGNA